ncbi:hypothetical protein KL918_002924 [Ogataea parapolymorpha]|uniref:DUF7907 domain-containing protein n=1 Tax=Ogataea parapolymorpha (strain ATCC 26012 / BCRC 20466 / JCM 22074 / NRRL Y-7560 / DL-1) TaxID=871575 RepID=W1Q9Q5_OGAPD|nr:hypothetical protein HPODL_01648 [Ogataea parapolymorpha DL-1]ESW97551.1 hypothetical protein HPODL_01648 [Ogataea parapolymorpha DL-1]KAG7866729.1 hypothetical protein KL918_002924 [Ogataea parapolymorpha]KAG7871880.1 hypothetical protein KL916_003483 [Ogataea parapolymorpha]
MRFSSTLALATIVASVLSQKVSLYVDAPGGDFRGKGLEPRHEGAALDYLFLTDGSSYSWNYDAATKKLIAPQAQYNFPITLGGAPYVAWGATPGYESFTFANDGTLQVNGSSNGFYACKNTNDPYRYSSTAYELMYYKNSKNVPPNSCTAIALKNVKPQPLNSNTKAVSVSSARSASGSSARPNSSSSSPTSIHRSGSVTSVTSRVTAASTKTNTVCRGNCSSAAISTFHNNAMVIAPAGAAILGGMAVFLL